MPWLLLWHTNSSEMKEKGHEVAEGKDHKKKSKALGIELKNYLMSVIPHVESADIKYSTSKDVMLPAEEVTQWSQSLEKLLATQCGQEAFREFLKSEFSDENIEFWLACEDYKKTQADCLHGKAEKIYKEFVQSDAIKQVNIDFHTRKETAQKAQDPTPSSFDEAQRLVYVLMETDSYPRFLKSRFYHNLLSKVEYNNFK
ncbi:regulator of G-protein signaling 1 [Rhineura floridana]|uniref:regulator of G-protein signaling 1 n=1 Tax=Rhineura floridana TaxID=261503 RepID=UPI002AC82DB2|nr:regulator of G-protein signaling 1 [Rhineura floridana]